MNPTIDLGSESNTSPETFDQQNMQSIEADVWDREYDTLRVIPSSTRALPSKPLLLFSELLNFGRFERVLDAGCGIGRNAIYLAQKGCQVEAVDLSSAALRTLNSTALSLGLQERITTHNCKLESVFPFESGFFDLVLDSYVFCHFTDDAFRENYRKELHRVTKPGGVVFSSTFSFADEYYQKILSNGGGKLNLVTDPNNGITKRLYTEQEIKEFFSAAFDLLYFVNFQFRDVVLGEVYLRSIFAMVLGRK